MIATILDYGTGNLHSLANALGGDDVDVRIVADPIDALSTDLLVLPGVGAFEYAATKLASSRDAMRSAILCGLPTIGICLGMQLLFDRSEEGDGDGLAVFAGTVTKLVGSRVPHIGWNTLDDVADALIPDSLADVYYANSFACRPLDQREVVAWTTHEGDRFPAVIRRRRVVGLQFHPEKSSHAGVSALRGVTRALVAA